MAVVGGGGAGGTEIHAGARNFKEETKREKGFAENFRYSSSLGAILISRKRVFRRNRQHKRLLVV